MEKIKMRLKECCLTCEHFSPDGIIAIVYGAPDVKREISCNHMPVCKKYLDAIQRDLEDVEWKNP